MYRLAFAVAALAACNTENLVVGDLQEIASIKAIPNRDLDILFVIDNSGSMADQQAELAANFPLMMDRLSELEGGLPNLHIGVVTSDLGSSGSNGQVGPTLAGLGGCEGLGDDGALRSSPAMSGMFISDIDDGAGGRDRNYTGELRDVFGEIAMVGVDGCGFEQHLGAMRRALTNPANAGFLRASANLAVVIIANEDDCSMTDAALLLGPDGGELGLRQSFRCTRFGLRCDESLAEPGDKTNCVPDETSAMIDPVQPFIDNVIALKGDERMVMVAGIVGDPAPVAVEHRDDDLALAHSCTFETSAGNPAVADPAVRLAAFLDGFPDRSTLTSICSGDLSAPLETIAVSAKKLLGDPCLDTSTLADASPEPGIQPACTAFDTRDAVAYEPLPSCADGGGDCYELVADPIVCPGSTDHLRVTFRRTAVTDDLWTSVRCQLR